uniref:Uncharacterized protein n=1 Tax=Lepeophtheirus salmonis TaxID=72036 RepID=A0A0K2VFY1_LEPSM
MFVNCLKSAFKKQPNSSNSDNAKMKKLLLKFLF